MYKKPLKITCSFIFLCAALLAISMAAYAMPACEDWQTSVQPNGEKFQYRQHGDENFNWVESETGEAIEKGQDGCWYFNELKDNKLQKSSVKYSKKLSKKGYLKSGDVLRWKKGLPLTGKNDTSASLQATQTGQTTGSSSTAGAIAATSATTTTASTSASTAALTTTTFTTHPNAVPNQKLLVVLVSFNDRALTYTDAQWNSQFFGTSGATFRNYYDENSGGKAIFGPVAETSGTANDGVVRVSLNRNHPGTADKGKISNQIDALIPEIMSSVNSSVNFAVLDTNGDSMLSPTELCTAIIIAGYEQSMGQTYPAVWAHRAMASTQTLDGVKIPGSSYGIEGEIHVNYMATLGVFCHEIGHVLGLPDLYDLDGSSYGVGIHSLMGTGPHNCLAGQYAGQTPAHMDAYCKTLLKYAVPQIANRAGQYQVNSFNHSTGYKVLRINTANPKQYFLIENREFNGFDASLSSYSNYGGIAVWHIDESVSDNNNEEHKMVDLEEANGSTELDFYIISPGDYNYYYASGSGYTLFNSTTTPDSRLYDGSYTDFQLNVSSASGNSMNVQTSDSEIYCDVQSSPAINSFTASSKVIRGGSVNVKAVITDYSTISKVTFRMSKVGLTNSTDINGVYAGNNTWEITVNPNDYQQGEGDFKFGLLVENSAGKITQWTSYPVVVTVDNDAPNVNLALNKTATASSQLSNEPAANAVNGTTYADTSSIHDKWCTGQGAGNNSWLKLDLGSIMTVNRWKVVHEKGSGSPCTGYYTSAFRLQISSDGVNNWTDVDVVTGNTLGVTDRFVTPFRARYVRLYINTADIDNCARIYEFQLFNDPTTGIAADFDGRNAAQASGFTRVMGTPYSSNIYLRESVYGYSSGLYPECSIKTNESYHSGNTALMLAGYDSANYNSYSYFTAYDDLNINVTANTTLSYWIMPQDQNGRYIGVDLEFDNGLCLRQYFDAIDQNGNSMHPDSGRGTVGSWNFIKCNLGQWCNGLTIKKILVAYDQPTSIGQFKGYIDDIVIQEEYPTKYIG
ncbi:M6 family metalloprotease domain-containing protein, partial [Acetivibrio cellulolyticus]|uniref:M6 family metalloprotease domain-containing protein n=1 Tax=Acetivibrio cellulolyticus TaxID=35830 RepID=UPI0002481B30